MAAAPPRASCWRRAELKGLHPRDERWRVASHLLLKVPLSSLESKLVGKGRAERGSTWATTQKVSQGGAKLNQTDRGYDESLGKTWTMRGTRAEHRGSLCAGQTARLQLHGGDGTGLPCP